MFTKQTFLTLVSSLAVFLLHGQSPRFDSYKILKNRKDIQVNQVYQDSLAYIWLGTNQGLARFDGASFEVFTTRDSLYSNSVTAILQGPSGRLWIGHGDGKITYREKKTFMKFNPEEGLPKKEISSFFVDKNKTLWFSTLGEGVYYYSGQDIRKKRLFNLGTYDGLLDNYVYNMVQDEEGLMYFGTDKGISVYNMDTDSFVNEITMSDGLPDNIVKHMAYTENNLWIGMEDGGMCKYSIDKKKFTTLKDWDFGSLNDFIMLSDKELWISTKRNGVITVTFDQEGKNRFEHFSARMGLASNRTNSIFLDREKNVWVGTSRGVSIRKNNHFEFLETKENFGISNIFSFVMDTYGNYWIASQDGLFMIKTDNMGRKNKTRLFTGPEYQYCSFISLHEDNQNFIWAGTYGFGVFRINPNTGNFDNYNTNDGLTNDNVIDISEDDQYLWFSTLGGGISRFHKDSVTFKTYSSANGLPSDYVYTVYPRPDQGNTWIATDGGGAAMLEKNRIKAFQYNNNEKFSKTIYSITSDQAGYTWMNSADKGLFVYTGDTIINYNEFNGLRTNAVKGFVSDREGKMVIISNEGINYFFPGDSSFTYFGEEHGVAYMEPNLNAVYKDHGDNIWIGHATGMLKINAPDTASKEITPKIFITRKSIFFNELEEKRNSFRYNENHLTFHYTALWFKSPNSLKYRYKLEGFDIDWNAQTNLKRVTYSNLPPGDYTFRVQVHYSGGTWTGSPSSRFSFTITPPFWKRAWFIIAMVLLGLTGIFTFIRVRLRNLERAKELLEEEVRKRTLEIQKQKDQIQKQKDEIEAQRDFVVEQRDKIEKQNEDITASIHYASKIQNAVLPPESIFKKELGDNFIFYRPKDIVSGDFYYLNQAGDKLIVAAADCTGHGVPGAFMSMLGISSLNRIISQLPKNANAGKILTALREEIKHALRQTGKEGEAKDGMDMSLCVIDRKQKFLDFAGAYNSLLISRKDEMIRHKGDRMPIGIHLKEKDFFTNKTIEVQDGDMLYLFTDGFQDQVGGEQKHKYMVKPLNQFLHGISGKPAQEQKILVQEEFDHWKGDLPQIDDVLVMGFRV